MKRLRLLIALIFTLVSLISFSQDLQINWQQCYGGSMPEGYFTPTLIEQVTDGYVILSDTDSNDGDVSGNHGNGDFWLFKIDFSGNILWSRCYGGSMIENARQLIKSEDGGFFVMGETGNVNDGDVSGNHGDLDFWLVKTDAQGLIEWQRCYGGTSQEVLVNTTVLSNNNLLLYGKSTSNDGDVSFNYGTIDAWIIEVTPEGEIVWEKSYGGIHTESINSAIETSDGGLLLCGYTSSSDGVLECDNSMTVCDGWIIKLDDDRNIEWQKCIGGTYSESLVRVISIEDGYLFLGGSDSRDGDVSHQHGDVGDGLLDVWVVKTDFDGNILWERSLGGSVDDRFQNIIQSVNGYLLLCSSASHNYDVSGNHSGAPNIYDIWLVKLNFEGEIMWEKCIGGHLDQIAGDFLLTDDNSLMISAYANQVHEGDDVDCDFSGIYNSSDVWIFKMDYYDNILINTGKKGHVEVSPNPSKDYVYFKYEFSDYSDKRSLVIYDLYGKLIHSEKITDDTGLKIWYPGNVSSGIYLYSIIDKDEIISGKVILID